MTNHFFKNVTIKNFRGIKSLEIDNLAQINIFVGENNCGKTSILEALFLITGISNPELALNVARFRNFFPTEARDIKDYFYQQNPETDFTISTKQQKDEKRNLTVKATTDMNGTIVQRDGKTGDKRPVLPSTPSTSDIKEFTGLKYEFEVNNKRMESFVSLFRPSVDRPGEFVRDIDIPKDYKENLFSNFSTPYMLYDARTVKDLLIDKKKDVLLEALKKIEPKVSDIMADDHLVRIDLGYGHFLPINLLGNGMTRILSVISNLVMRKGHFLLFDEIESGLHVSSITTLWEAILKNAKPQNAQIFMTTHSLDVLKGLRNVGQDQLPLADVVDIACFQIEKSEDDTLRAYRYSAKQMEKAIHEIGIDIRQ